MQHFLIDIKNCTSITVASVSNCLIGDLKDHFTAKVPDSASGQFASGSAPSEKDILLIKHMGPFRGQGLSI